MADRNSKNFYNEQFKDLLNRYGSKSNLSDVNSENKIDDSPKSRIKTSTKALEDLTSINEQNIKNYRSRSVRNRVLIVILAIFLIISIITVCLVAASIYRQNNVFLYTHGDVGASFFVDGMQVKRFRTPTDIRGNVRFDFDVDLDIQTSGDYNIRFVVNVFQGEEKIKNLVYHEPNKSLFYDGHDGYLYSKECISGGQRIDVILGVYIDYEYQNTLNINNFRMEVHAYFEKV